MLSAAERTSRIEGMVYASMFGALTAIGALVSFPLPLSPVPITLQNLFFLIAAALTGARLAALSQMVYILIGVLGLPVFAGGKGGLGVLIGPTGGYLAGFVAGAFVTGMLVRKIGTGFVPLLTSMAAGIAVMYALGVLQLSVLASLSLEKSFYIGVLPFIPGDAVKIIAAALIVLHVRKLMGGTELK